MFTLKIFRAFLSSIGVNNGSRTLVQPDPAATNPAPYTLVDDGSWTSPRDPLALPHIFIIFTVPPTVSCAVKNPFKAAGTVSLLARSSLALALMFPSLPSGPAII